MSSEATSRSAALLQSEPFFYVPTDAELETEGGAGTNSWSSQGSDAKGLSNKREREAYERGLQEGEKRMRANADAGVVAARSEVNKTLSAFEKERDEYFNRIEPEVVQLALAIAKKILHREAQMDPLLLTGLVHVALEKLDAGTHVRLRVNPADIHFWNEYFARSSGDSPAPELVGDASRQPGECSIETEVGSTLISMETQLKEIEQGFFDLLEQRPRTRE